MERVAQEQCSLMEDCFRILPILFNYITAITSNIIGGKKSRVPQVHDTSCYDTLSCLVEGKEPEEKNMLVKNINNRKIKLFCFL